MTNVFRDIFYYNSDQERDRSKYLSRLFGIFSEKVVSVWANDEHAPFENLGRPTLRYSGNPRGHTLDFTFRERTTGKIYVAEMKCEIEFQNFKYFVLKTSQQLDHHKKDAFRAFLISANDPDQLSVSINKKEIEISGAILIWGAVCHKNKLQIKNENYFYDILSVEDIIQDLVQWNNQEYFRMIETYRGWSSRLFDGLTTVGSSG